MSSLHPQKSRRSQLSLTLCAPFPGVTCFGCCPPIRPAGYDPLDYAGSLRREFRDNRARYQRQGPRPRPIIGFTCWALGNLDPSGRTIGCLLHPLQNEGEDLRHLVDYEGKCARESCLAARQLAPLPDETVRFWLELARGLSSLHYSSPRANPLFHLLLWGPRLLQTFHMLAQMRSRTLTDLIHEWPFLLDRSYTPRADRYLVESVINLRPSLLLEGGDAVLQSLVARLKASLPAIDDGIPLPTREDPPSFVHHLPISSSFQDFLRLALQRPRCSLGQAALIAHQIDERLRSAIAGGALSTHPNN